MAQSKQQISLDRLTRLGLWLGLIGALLLFGISGVINYSNIRSLRQQTGLLTNTHDVLMALDDVESLATDAETAERGYLISGNETHLAPYSIAVNRIAEHFTDLERLTAEDPHHQRNIPMLRSRWEAKLETLENAIAARRATGLDAAAEAILTERGRAAMDAIREQVATMQKHEQDIRRERLDAIRTAYASATQSGILAIAFGILISTAVAYLVRQNMLNRKRQEWLQSGQLRLSEVMTGDPKLDQLCGNVLRFFADYLDARAGAFYVADDGVLRKAATFGIPAANSVPEVVEPGDGLLAQSFKLRRILTISDIPKGYLTFGSSFGHSEPRHLAIVPASVDGLTNSVFELGFAEPIEAATRELLERMAEPIGSAIRSVNYRTNLQNLLDETQRQAEELQAQSEELRVSNEELEEQSRALRDSQSELENQQVELETTNSQLEQQSRILEAQRNEVASINSALELKARELEQASRYKSDFLANMSHELRTPLNSALILAKLLSDNPSGNLSEEQVQYATTIHAAGNDLLTLINDILDLAKIEAGHMEVQAEPLQIQRIVADLERVFRPVAEHKGLAFHIEIHTGTPASIESDRQRLDQILKNLLSNAIKFTQEGEVKLSIRSAGKDRLSFAVSDTGIGIAADHQEKVFDAFQQVDGTANRKFGGTGLGLSISRELTRLLAGELNLESEPEQGSTFTLTLPLIYEPALVQPRSTPMATQTPRLPAQNIAPDFGSTAAPRSTIVAVDNTPTPRLTSDRSPHPPAQRVPDDRESLTAEQRLLLVVEDDEAFSRILVDLAHELGYQCIVSSTAEEACTMAAQYQPSAVVLDIGLPDHSGLWVLDRLKADRRTRHVPVHVISAGDYAQTALSLGAVGYLLKPVKRDELADALKHLESRLEQKMHRVLVVEDDLVQLQSLRALLGSQDVDTVGAQTAAECLDLLKGNTFDCMVLDLTLPDASGYSLLEKLSREDAYSFPPVIVYTGRELSTDEEHRLRRFSKSIIIKGARSPERLLDEVTLFLHKVVSDLPVEQQRMLERSRSRDGAIEGRRVLVVEDDVRNVFALTSILEPRGASVVIARNGREALDVLARSAVDPQKKVDLVLMDVMMPEMDGLTAVREIRKLPEFKKLPVIMLTAKAMKDDQEQCLQAGANDYMAKPLDVEKLLSLVRVWMPR